MKKTLLCLLFFSLLLPSVTKPQSANLIYFGTEHGLPHSSIYTMVQDSIGNLWMGTHGGVCKYDGQCKNFSTKNGLAENWVTASCIDRTGNIWFGHWAGGISRYSVSKDSIEKISTKGVNITKLISKIYEDKSGIIWIATEGEGIIKCSPGAETRFEQFTTKDGLCSNTVFSIVQDKNGILWFGSDEGISRLNGKDFQNFTSRNGFTSKNIRSLLQDSEGNLWVGTQDSGAFVFSSQSAGDNGLGSPVKRVTVKNGLKNNFVTCIFEDRAHNIWLGTFGGGITKITRKKNGEELRLITTNEGLSNNKVLSVLEDREGNIWIGTYIGLNQFRAEVFQTLGIQDGLHHSLVWSLLQEQNGTFFMGTEGGLMRFSPNEEKSEKRFMNMTEGKGFVENNITCVYDDHKGNIWFSAWGEGVGKLTISSGKIERLRMKDGLSDENVFCISSDKDGGIWFGTNKNGACRYDTEKKVFKHFSSSDGLGNDRVYSLFCDSKNNLWFGTLGGGVSRYDGNGFKTFSEKDSLKHNFVLSITEDKSGNIWMGTYGGGLYEFDGNKFSHFDITDGMNSDTPYLLIADKDNLWIGTSLGIDKFNVSQKSFSHYGKEEGFLGIETNPNAVCKDNAGNLWFGTIAGVVKYNALNDKENTVEPVVCITGVKILFKDVDLARIPHDESFNAILSYHQNNLTFDFVGVSLSNPKKVKYLYKLEGFDSDWMPESSVNSITYQNIPPGEYAFLVKACNNDKVWSRQPARFSFSIKPPFWQTRWFFILAALCIVLVVYILIVIRTRSILAEKKLLEQKVKERTLEIAQKNKDITDSIVYAKRIQEAILPVKSEVQKGLKDSFILYMPRDIVSGDFYWYSKIKDKICIAAVDCTGHGVPGALMSMVGNELLNQIVNVREVTDPGMALNILSSGVRIALKQDKQDSETRDGMDISICFFDPVSKKLQFAGANRPMYIIRVNPSNTGDSEGVEVIKGNKFPVGGMQTGEKINFTTHTIQMETGDCFYIFTDGYMDQFGGESGKKFMAKRFRETLLSHTKSLMSDQEKLLATEFGKWKGELYQVDDVLVIGVRI